MREIILRVLEDQRTREYGESRVVDIRELSGRYNAMTVDYGTRKQKQVFKVVKDLGCGAGETSCIECDGSGKWPFASYVVPLDIDCVDCKGSGKILVSIA